MNLKINYLYFKDMHETNVKQTYVYPNEVREVDL